MTRVAFVGLGHMGSHMCRHVVAGGYEVAAYDLDRAAIRRLVRSGARGAGSLPDCLEGAEVLITSLPGPPQVEAVLSEALGLLDPGSLAIEMSTSSLDVGRRVGALARARKISFVDAPVAGQTIGASAGTLAIFVGGTRKAFSRALPLLETIGDPERISHLGPSGSGYTVKLLLNVMWFMHMVATAEALTVGVKAGVPLDKLHEALIHSQANSVFMEHDLRMILDDGDYDEGFAMKLVGKDLALAVGLARDVGVPVEMAALVEQINARARAAFGDNAGEMSSVRLYEELAGVQLRLPKGGEKGI